MPFESINSSNPKTNPWNFHKHFLRFGDFEKQPFWKSAIFIYFFSKKNCFVWSPWKNSHKLCDTTDGTRFWFPENFLLLMRNISLYNVHTFPGTIHLIRQHNFGVFLILPLCQHKYCTERQQNWTFTKYNQTPTLTVILLTFLYGWLLTYIPHFLVYFPPLNSFSSNIK